MCRPQLLATGLPILDILRDDIITWLEAKYRRSIESKHKKAIKRRQFNMTVDERIVLGVKALAAILEVPRYVITEHLLQVGTYHILTTIKDEDKRRQLEEHLVKGHLLGTALSDHESISDL